MFEESEKTMEKRQQMIIITKDLKSSLGDFKLNCFINQFYLYTFYVDNIHTSAVLYDLKKKNAKKNNTKHYCKKRFVAAPLIVCILYSVNILYIYYDIYNKNSHLHSFSGRLDKRESNLIIVFLSFTLGMQSTSKDRFLYSDWSIKHYTKRQVDYVLDIKREKKNHLLCILAI